MFLTVIDEVFTSCLCICVRVRGSKVQEEGTSNERRAKQSNTGKCLLLSNLLSALRLS